MAIHLQNVSQYVETEIPEGMSLGAYRVRNVNRDGRRVRNTRPVTIEEAKRILRREARRNA